MKAERPKAPSRRPSPLRPALELRVILEAATLPWALPLLLTVPRGDGHPVLMLPGFMGGESIMICHEAYLRCLGYDVSQWGLGRNVGFQVKHANALHQKIRYLHYKTGRKVSLVGWSLGGIFALYGAQQAPECVRQVITLGTPLGMGPSLMTNIPRTLDLVYRLAAHPLGYAAHFMRPAVMALLREHMSVGVHLSCLYGQGDGIVPPREATMDGDEARHENIRVPACHLGMALNPMVMWVVAERLAQPEGHWRPFDPSGVPGRIYHALTPAAWPI